MNNLKSEMAFPRTYFNSYHNNANKSSHLLQSSIEKRNDRLCFSSSMLNFKPKRKVVISDCAELLCYDSTCPILNSIHHKKTFSLKKSSLSYSMRENSHPSSSLLRKPRSDSSATFLPPCVIKKPSISLLKSAEALGQRFLLKPQRNVSSVHFNQKLIHFERKAESKESYDYDYSQSNFFESFSQLKPFNRQLYSRKREEEKGDLCISNSMRDLAKKEVELVKSIKKNKSEIDDLIYSSDTKRSKRFADIKILQMMRTSGSRPRLCKNS